MITCLDPRNFPCAAVQEEQALASGLDKVLSENPKEDIFELLGGFHRILRDNRRREEWDETFEKLNILFKCGRFAPLDGPMIGISMTIRDSDYFRETARTFGKDRSVIANIEWMATAWNATFAGSGIWMGKTFESLTRETFAAVCGKNAEMMNAYNPDTTRIGRNLFREPANPDLLQGLGIPVLTKLWHLKDRPLDPRAELFGGILLAGNLEKERAIPYSKTGGVFLALPGKSVLDDVRGKEVYQLNYRWPLMEPAYPMTRLVDEIVQIAQGVYLGRLVMATRHYSLGTLRMSLFGERSWDLGEAYRADRGPAEYGYQNNGYFLMIDTAFARDAYDGRAFPFLRPRKGEAGYAELGYDKASVPPAVQAHAPICRAYPEVSDWAEGWRSNETLKVKFTTFCLEPSPKGRDDGDVLELLRDGESILQMLQRIQKEISAAALFDDHVRRFEQLNRLFRCGAPPSIVNGVFQGRGGSHNTRFDAPESRDWYGKPEPCTGFDYYHGATLNLHFGFADTFCTDIERKIRECAAFPGALAGMLQGSSRGPDLLNAVWATIGRFIFPWAGKSFERISGRKLSMLLDESDDLESRYADRVAELKNHPASWPHYDVVVKNREHHWSVPGAFDEHLKHGSWDQGMPEVDRAFWREEAAGHWVFGSNLQDSRILPTDLVFHALDMNYHAPLPSIQAIADEGPSPFVRQGYVFLGVSDRESILPMNHGTRKKRVFQFHYRYPMIGGAVPIGMCLDELVEIAQGLYLGQLIYTTEPFVPFHSSVASAEYHYQLFGYFLLLDNTWERHRRAIDFDVNVA
jgi:hypothetical protein